MLYNLSEFITTVKEDVGIMDLPLPVNDKELIDHFKRKTLKDFSLIYPRMEKIMIGDEALTKRAKDSFNTFYEYRIPRYVYEGSTILSIVNFDVARPNGYSDFFIPNANWSTPDTIIAAMGDVRMAAGLASALAKAPTCDFIEPDILQVYNGWAGGKYMVELLLEHDPSLASVPAGAMNSLRELAELDMKAFLYNKLKRKDSLEVGVGTIQLKIDDWSNAESERKDLLRDWKESANLDFDHIKRF